MPTHALARSRRSADSLHARRCRRARDRRCRASATCAPSDVTEKTPGDLVTIADRESEIALARRAARAAARIGRRRRGGDGGRRQPARPDRRRRGVDHRSDRRHRQFRRRQAARSRSWSRCSHDGETRGRLDPRSAERPAVPCARAAAAPSSTASRVARARQRRGAAASAASARCSCRPTPRRDRGARRRAGSTSSPIPRCAGEQYPRIALGENDFALFERTPALGSCARRAVPGGSGRRDRAGSDGTPYRVGSRRHRHDGRRLTRASGTRRRRYCSETREPLPGKEGSSGDLERALRSSP